ncbi:MAG: hypothetical protein JSU57_04260 [Candidatus Heimdallarchaeota archaeon]|nr:MAG: hypothetical protein JSU57_04260 [Candidatus Heimdallarchaeota archaeon]
MKEIRNGTTLFLLVILIFAFSAQGSAYFFQFNKINTRYSSNGTERIMPLRKNIPLPSDIPLTGIIPTSKAPRSPRGSINEIVDPQDQYFPGSNIRIRNRFTIPAGLAIVQQVIYIFLFENNTSPQIMKDEGNSSEPITSTYYVHHTITNGTPAGAASYSTDPSHGWIDTTFQLPNMTKLTSMGISSDDYVTIFQYYPAHNRSESSIGTPINHTDTFKLSAAAEFSSAGFVNDASNSDTFRSGENATAILSAKSGITPIDNVTVTISNLYNKSSTPDLEINPTTYGIYADLLAFDNKTDTNGELALFVDTTYLTTPEGEYSFNITADFTGTDFYAVGYEKITSITVNFTIYNEPDIVTDSLFTITAEPASISTPDVRNSIVTVHIQADAAYDRFGVYNLSKIPVKATLNILEPWVNISLAAGFSSNGTAGWTLTNSNGEAQFNITAGFPIPYENKTPIVTVIADLQNSSAPIYPPSEPHRFLENDTGGKILNKSQMISIDPEFWIGEIDLAWSNTTSVRPGEDAELHYEVRKDGEPPGTNTFAGVPVNISLDKPIPGVSLDMSDNSPYLGSKGYYYTDSSGIIVLKIRTTYLLTPEIVQKVKLNLTVDFENDSNVRWIGNQHKGYGSFEDFDKTWLSRLSTPTEELTIDPDFNNCTIIFLTTNESGDTTIRPGDNLTIKFRVQDEGGSPLSNVSAKIALGASYPGVSLTIHPQHTGSQDPLARPNYYQTDSSGNITVALSTSFITTPKILDIELIATADFENDSIPYDKWLVGSKGARSDFRSNSSYSETSQNISVKPQYFIGKIFIRGDPDEVVPQNATLDIEFELRLLELDTGAWVSPPGIIIDGVNISIEINGMNPKLLAMNVTPSSNQYSKDSFATFHILTNATGLTQEGNYTIEAKANFGAAQGLIYNFTQPYPDTVSSEHLLGAWVNGTYSDGYSNTSFQFEVKNIDLIKVWIAGVTDPFHTDAKFNNISGLFEVYRVTTDIIIEGTYKDKTQDPVPDREITISLTHSLGTIDLDTVTSLGDGTFSVVVNLPATTPLEDNVMINGWDSDVPAPDPQEYREGYNNIRVVTSIGLDFDLSNFNGTSVFIGRNVSISGTLTDNLDSPIDNSTAIFTDSFSELTGRLRVIGWNGTHEIGYEVVTSPYANGTYDMSYQIPLNYTYDDTLYIRLNIIANPGLIHYRINYAQKLINVYWDFEVEPLQIYFPSNGTTTNLTHNNVYVVKGIENRDISINGTLKDQSGRELDSKWISATWNGSSSPYSVNAAGYFSLDYSFTGWENNTWVWQLYHILDNGTVLSKYYEITLQWKVYDEYAPIIDITSPMSSNGIALLQQNDVTQISVTVIDPDPTSGFVSVGLDNLSVTIWINGISDVMDQDPINGYIFTYDWDTSNPLDISYNITVSAADLSNNWNKTEIEIMIDIVNPSATIEVSENNDGYLIVDLDTGYVPISGTIMDNSSETGWNTGIDNTSVRLFIINPFNQEIKISTSISISDNSYEYELAIFNPDDLSRNDSLRGTEDWTIRLTFSDLAGNVNYTERDVKLDNKKPKLNITDGLPDVVDEELIIHITFDDQETGIYIETLTLELYNSTGAVLDTILFEDANFTERTDNEARIVLDTSELDEGDYSIKIIIFDNTGNREEITSESFTISRPGPPDIFGNIFLIILSPLLAFGGGIGIAALYERFKGIRGA